MTATESALATLEADARRRGVSLATVLREAVEDRAHMLRTARQPRVGVARSTDGRSAAEVTLNPVARLPR